MNTRFAQIDLSRLPAPEVIEPLDYEGLLAEMKAYVAERDPDLAAVLELESEPAVKVLQAAAYFRLLDRARVNDAARAVLLPHATGADLDNLAALLGVARLVITPGDLDAAPPVAPVMESDARLRERAQLSLQAYSTAGPAGAYRYWAMTTSADVLDAHVDSPAPGDVRVVVLPDPEGNLDDAALVQAVTDMVTREDIRVLCDNVYVALPTFLPVAVEAELDILDGPDPAPVLAAAEAALDAYLAQTYRLGGSVTRSGIMAALHREGVREVTLTAPAASVNAAPDEVPEITLITITEAV
ncbi:baseplate assembly protein [Roseinatronobacter sp.]|uniref:baseplate assembly protein n=1 Tax=Roseinatronobacter sp. TaxID=1945755 RepID=UPI0025D0FC20|nr:baseplate J/gp47 family protein [Roseibaca sp.]